MALHSLFPTIVYDKLFSVSLAKKLNKDILTDVKVLQEIDDEGQAWSRKHYAGGYTSYSSVADLHLRHSPFMDLKKLIDKEVKAYIQSLEVDLKGRKAEMTTCWVNVMPPLVHHSLHLHPLCFISGTYYVQVPQGSGTIKLEDPRMGLYMAAPPRRSKPKKLNPYFYEIQPKSGQLLLWESWLRHEVTANRGSGQRVSVSFNYEWV